MQSGGLIDVEGGGRDAGGMAAPGSKVGNQKHTLNLKKYIFFLCVQKIFKILRKIARKISVFFFNSLFLTRATFAITSPGGQKRSYVTACSKKYGLHKQKEEKLVVVIVAVVVEVPSSGNSGSSSNRTAAVAVVVVVAVIY